MTQSSVIALPNVGAMTSDQVRALREFDAAIVSAVNAARDAGVLQGLLVGLLHGHAHLQTRLMVGQA